MARPSRTIYFDAMVLVQPHMSGVGHNALEIVRALERQNDQLEICLFVTLGKKKHLKRHNLGASVRVRTVPMPARVMEGLLRTRLLPPVDLLLGKGLYIFPNYKKLPLKSSDAYLYVHDVAFARHPEYVQPKNLAYLSKYVPGWMKAATKVITISQFSKREILDLFPMPEDKIVVIPCGVDQNVFYKQDQYSISKAKQKYKIEANNYFLYVGNLEPRKNIKNLVMALDSLPAEIKKTHALVLIGGGGWLNEDIYQEIDAARSKGATIIMPDAYVADEDLPAIFSGAIALTHPAHYEGFGLSVVQAMACEVPVIVAHNSSIPEMVGDAGMYINPLDVKSIAAAMVSIANDRNLRDMLATQGLQKAKNFSWDSAARGLLDITP